MGNPHHTLEAERMAERFLLVEQEELEKYLDRQLMESSAEWAVSNLGDQPVRAVKNGLITLITCACRAAIRYGVDPEFSYTLSDYYIGFLETLNTPRQLMELMRSILLHYNELVSQAKAPQFSKNVNRGIEYISRNLYLPIQVKEVAEYVGLEPHYFSSLFKRETGITPYRYILKQKLETAKEMLDHSQDSVTYIASSLGFCDASHFEKRFKEAYGLTPLAYKNRACS